METGPPRMAAIEVMTPGSSPHGRMISKPERSVETFRANP
jgi:hypothetical protein